ncbi:sigma-70 family RNA polymerase sigma factor [Myxococcota bacterium]|nr:sigma-70 family RNA polymerase sigma factor [Myxococcota bacterium]
MSTGTGAESRARSRRRGGGTLSTYLDEIGRYPPLDAETERELLRRWSDLKDKHAGEAIVRSNLRFVVAEARRQFAGGDRFADLVQAGNQGLVEALQKFDPERGVRFLTYARWWIRARITSCRRQARAVVRAPRTDEPGGTAPVHQVSLESVTAESETPLSRLTCMWPDQETQLARSRWMDSLKDAVDGALKILPHREAQIVKARYLSDDRRTLRTLGKQLGISRERVRQLEQRALRRVKDHLENAGVEADDPIAALPLAFRDPEGLPARLTDGAQWTLGGGGA